MPGCQLLDKNLTRIPKAAATAQPGKRGVRDTGDRRLLTGRVTSHPAAEAGEALGKPG